MIVIHYFHNYFPKVQYVIQSYASSGSTVTVISFNLNLNLI